MVAEGPPIIFTTLLADGGKSIVAEGVYDKAQRSLPLLRPRVKEY